MDMMIENTVVPKLRFGEFEDDWNNHLLDDIATFLKGKGISKSELDDDGKTECIRYGELYIYYNELIDEVKSKTNLNNIVLSKANDVIIPASGETHLDIATASCVLRSGIALGGDLNIIRTDNNGVFLSYYLNSKKKFKIARLSQGSSVVHLYASQLKTLKLNLPSLPEQQKIASFLSAVDNKLQQLTKKKELLEEYKKGVMQKIFSQELSFKDDNGNSYPDWEEKRFGDLIDLVIDNRGKTPPISDEGIYLIEVNAIGRRNINYTKIKKFVSSNTFESWFRKYLTQGDVLFSTVGNTAVCSLYQERYKAGIAQNIVGLRFKDDDDSTFMYYLLTEPLNNHKFKRIEMGAVQPSVKVSQMIHIFFSVPCFEEQQKISNFLTSLDGKIDLVSTQIENTKAFKKGLLQQMFV